TFWRKRGNSLHSIGCITKSDSLLERAVVTPRRQARQGFSVRYQRCGSRPEGDADAVHIFLFLLGVLAPWREQLPDLG
ncbi:hypothetical protein, partial [uncultured Thiodictyon sp.]|uniref:hypothetical protein n=1 Tax=uncultured Thiodictyon sp. TaxID=1846217 RepID=UPI0025DE2E6C